MFQNLKILYENGMSAFQTSDPHNNDDLYPTGYEVY